MSNGAQANGGKPKLQTENQKMLTGTQKSKIRTAVEIYRKRVALLPLIDGSENGATKFRAQWHAEDRAAYEAINNGHDFVVRGVVERIVYGSAWRA